MSSEYFGENISTLQHGSTYSQDVYIDDDDDDNDDDDELTTLLLTCVFFLCWQ